MSFRSICPAPVSSKGFGVPSKSCNTEIVEVTELKDLGRGRRRRRAARNMACALSSTTSGSATADCRDWCQHHHDRQALRRHNQCRCIDHTIVEMLVALAKDFRMTVVAEESRRKNKSAPWSRPVSRPDRDISSPRRYPFPSPGNLWRCVMPRKLRVKVRRGLDWRGWFEFGQTPEQSAQIRPGAIHHSRTLHRRATIFNDILCFWERTPVDRL
ncbi:hypothetical protein L6654_33235 [Bradyrhizobium sp. WYCCWR 13023]|uniref:Uncharacterized protein n=1 Tax=Bradyrhizobium zhengyangense TaxID=2911009 RepID=A0A9X1RHR3_9BRAD|nr:MULTISPECIES: hypothetical protein [Bradyrhizobium]MCG2631503.1 hypothetical protein [Bradyrhizobium zhengyangense]MCG2671363.1 hypothetical protein [Bradyrhizobium zhengyangense]